MEDTPTTPTNVRSMADVLASRKPNERSVDILLQPSLNHDLTKLEKEYARVSKRSSNSLGDRTAARVQAEINDLYDEIAANTQTFVFRDIGNRAYDVALNDPDHRPTDEQLAQWKKIGMDEQIGPLAYNTDTFPVFLISACAVDPTITLTEARAIIETWSEGDIEALFFTAIAACKERTAIPFGDSGFARMNDSAPKSAIAEMPESLTPNSLDGQSPTD